MGRPQKPAGNGLGALIVRKCHEDNSLVLQNNLSARLEVKERTLRKWIRSQPSEKNNLQGKNFQTLCVWLRKDHSELLEAYRSAADYDKADLVSGSSPPKNEFSDQHERLNLTDEALIRFYYKENIFCCVFGEVKYKLPLVQILEPVAGTGNHGHQVVFTFDECEFLLQANFVEMTQHFEDEAAKKPRNFNGRTVRLRSLRGNGSRVVGVLQAAYYFDAVRTNFVMDAPIRELGNQSLREYYHGKSRRLPAFEDDIFANHLGVVAMIESFDGYLIIQKRSIEVIGRSNTTSSSASGVLDLSRITSTFRSKNEINIDDMLHAGMKPEIVAELGIGEREGAFLGIFRELQRGGKPEIYFFLRSTFSRRQILAGYKYAEERWETDGLIFEPLNSLTLLKLPEDQFDCKLNEWVNDNYQRYVLQKANITLKMGILLVGEYLRATFRARANDIGES